MASTPLAEARPTCSRPASISSKTSSDIRSNRCCIRALSSAVSGHRQPLPPCSTVPRTSKFMPATFTENRSGRSSTLGLILNIKPPPSFFESVRSRMRSFIRAIGSGMSARATPRAEAKFPSGSASTATTGRPDWACRLASAAVSVVLPTPPLPTTATFIVHASNEKRPDEPVLPTSDGLFLRCLDCDALVPREERHIILGSRTKM